MYTNIFGKLHASNKKQGRIATFLLQEGVNTVGRAVQEHKSMIEIFDDEFLGRLHFSIEVNKDQLGRIHYILFDNNSRNGTSFYCKETKTQKKLQPLDRIIIVKGDQIKAGNTYFEIEPPQQPQKEKNRGGEQVDTVF